MLACTPAPQWLGETRNSSFIALRERTDQHHPAPAQTLFCGGQPGFHRSCDFGGRPADDIVKDHGQAIDDRQAGKRILELIVQLGTLEDTIGPTE